MRKILLSFALLFGIGLIGCTGQSSSSTPDKKDKDKVVKNQEDDHGGWWCNPHGLPEEECWACNDEYLKKCKDMNDWCKDHERPQSQCFKCDPKLIAKWAKVYELKEGKKPPTPKNY